MALKFKMSGGVKVAANVRSFSAKMTKAQKAGLERFNRKVLNRALEGIPVDEGHAYESGRIETSEKGLSSSVVFGGGEADPQVLVIERHPSEFTPPSWQGKEVSFSPEGTGPHYLEEAFLYKSANMTKTLAEDMKVERVWGIG